MSRKRRGPVIGSTHSGRPALSDYQAQYKIARNRTLRFICESDKRREWEGWYTVWVSVPFHSRYYGIMADGSTKQKALSALADQLAFYGYIGRLIETDVDSADLVGVIDPRLVSNNTRVTPIPINIFTGA